MPNLYPTLDRDGNAVLSDPDGRDVLRRRTYERNTITPLANEFYRYARSLTWLEKPELRDAFPGAVMRFDAAHGDIEMRLPGGQTAYLGHDRQNTFTLKGSNRTTDLYASSFANGDSAVGVIRQRLLGQPE